MQWFDPTHPVCYVTSACPLSRQDLTVEVWVMVTVKAMSFPDTNLSCNSLSIPGERRANGSSAQASVSWSWKGSMGPRCARFGSLPELMSAELSSYIWGEAHSTCCVCVGLSVMCSGIRFSVLPSAAVSWASCLTLQPTVDPD